ncbi:GT4 family glycosyltransferase PelF [Kutzneria sp. NPDC052558]|uniref:GT4 family glycosyltransferase PelF n=1 Tax=Kutzneria sp. NPDC052558 TaxID=3364121 RepID=UPI0037C95DC0
MTGIALMTEGTYPHSFGGVSVWCDQLVRGMADYDYHVVALVGGGDPRVAWELPANVASVTAIPLWGGDSGVPRIGRAARARFRPLGHEFLSSLLDRSDTAVARFGVALRQLFEYAQQDSLTAALRTDDTVRTLTEIWHDHLPTDGPAAPTLFDALECLQLLEHLLRPLSARPVRAAVSHCVANGLAVLPALAARWSYGTPILLTEHGIYLRERYLGYRVSPYRWATKAMVLGLFRQLCSLAYLEASQITPGNMYNQRWEERLGADHAIIRTVYNGVEPDHFPPVEAEPEAPTVSWAGRVDPIKDIETLLRAFALVRQRIPDARLRLFGGTPAGGQAYLDRCRALADQLGVGDCATFEGRVDNIRDAYVAGHVVVLSSISEGFPYTVIEAMTCGRPCVATDVGGVAEAIGETGLVVPPRDPDAMAEACVTLLGDPELRTRMGAEARQRVLTYFTLDQAITTFGQLYRALAAGEPVLVGAKT